MKVKYIKEISDPNEFLILEINERVDQFLYADDLSDIDKAILKADKGTLKHATTQRVHLMSENLIKKIDYLLGESE